MEWKVLSIEKYQIYLVFCSLIRTLTSSKVLSLDIKNKKNRFLFCIVLAYSYLCRRIGKGEVLEWLKRHAWKACNRQNRFAGSNPVLSAEADSKLREKTRCFYRILFSPQ